MQIAMDSGSSKGKLSEWVIQVNENLSKMEPSQPKEQVDKNGRRCIYSLFNSSREKNGHLSGNSHHFLYKWRDAEIPLGPYYYERDDEKKAQNEALLHFLGRSGKALEDYIKAVKAVVEELKDAYDELDSKWQDDRDAFVRLMVVDGCFLIEMLRGSRDPESYYAADHPLLRIHNDPGDMKRFRQDMLKLENQLPMQLLEVLLEVDTGDNHNVREILEDCIAKIFSMEHISIRYGKNYKCKHILDAYRKGLVGPSRARKRRSTRGGFLQLNIPSATQLNKVGIGFTICNTSKSGISFRRAYLRLPQIVVDDENVTRLFDIISFELLHEDAGFEVCSYIYFMGKLIQDDNDVSLLKSCGIINSALPDDEVAGLFLRMTEVIIRFIKPGKPLAYEYWNTGIVLREGYNKMQIEWRADLFQKYLRSPWAMISLTAAILLFVLSFIQTVYTVLSYVNRK